MANDALVHGAYAFVALPQLGGLTKILHVGLGILGGVPAIHRKNMREAARGRSPSLRKLGASFWNVHAVPCAQRGAQIGNFTTHFMTSDTTPITTLM